ncbi:hypothetical protein M3P36_06680 [Altererythrobacter sp. KTW20L]|uniref:PilZ domain-containing protein n=1 Tax=Altererythrobacter sp. KTW20L TaxID=2942210 RepID=UPI0020C0E890|nr:PilZ domain-containing protein [Altererythrobacter sp. KTW20L]MCL6250729.1 hypothetical protein [Altererythrobacter sp. KTW20L]
MGLAIADKPRVEPRVRAMVRARLRDSAGERDVCIIDVSTRGLLMTTACPPGRGEFVELIIGPNRLTALVKWSGERRFGLSLRERVSVAAMLEGGAGAVALAVSPARARRTTNHWAALAATPQALARIGQFAMVLAALMGAGFILTELVSSGFDPMRAAMLAQK